MRADGGTESTVVLSVVSFAWWYFDVIALDLMLSFAVNADDVGGHSKALTRMKKAARMHDMR